MKFACVITLLLVLFAAPGFAADDRNLTVDKLGAQPTISYVSFVEGLSVNCLYNAVYIENDTDFGKIAYSTLLTAKSTNKKISRFVYAQGTDQICRASLVEIAD